MRKLFSLCLAVLLFATTSAEAGYNTPTVATPGGSNGQLQYNNNGALGGLANPLPVANGGTGAVTAALALDNLAANPTAGTTGLLARVTGNSYSVVSNLSGLCGTIFSANSCASFFGYYDPRNFGVKSDGIKLFNLSTTSGSNSVSSTSYTFTSSDAGKMISILGGGANLSTTGNIVAGSHFIAGLASTSGVVVGDSVFGSGFPVGTRVMAITSPTRVQMNNVSPNNASASTIVIAHVLNTTISSASGGSALLATNAGTTSVAGQQAVFGTGDGAAFNSMLTAISAGGTASGLIHAPTSVTIIDQSLVWPTNVSLTGGGAAISIFYWLSTSDMTSGLINGSAASSGTPNYNNQWTYFEMDLSSATAGTYSVQAKCIEAPYTVNSVIDHVYCHDSPATGLATDYGNPTQVTNNVVVNPGRLGSLQSGSNGIGEGVVAAAGTQSFIITGNYIQNPMNNGVLLESQNGALTNVSATIANNVIVQGLVQGFPTQNGPAGVEDAGVTGAIITDNTVFEVQGGSGSFGGIYVSNGTYGSALPGIQGVIANNHVYGVPSDGIELIFTTSTSTNTLYSVHDNEIQGAGGACIELYSNATVVEAKFKINNNMGASCGRSGIAYSGTAGFKNVQEEDNGLYNNGAGASLDIEKAGTSINTPIVNFTMHGNVESDDGSGYEKYGLSINTSIAVTNALLTDNNFTGVATAPYDVLGSITGMQTNNLDGSPAIANGAAAGTSPGTATVVGNNQRGVISVTTGTSTASGILDTITFGGARAIPPSGCSLTPQNAASALAAAMIYATSPSTTSWTISVGGTPLTASTAYSWSYSCL